MFLLGMPSLQSSASYLGDFCPSKEIVQLYTAPCNMLRPNHDKSRPITKQCHGLVDFPHVGVHFTGDTNTDRNEVLRDTECI